MRLGYRLAAGAILTMLAAPTSAATITSTDTFGPTALESLGSVTLSPFDASLGTLDEVMVEIDASITGSTTVDRSGTGGPMNTTVGGSATYGIALETSSLFGSDLLVAVVDAWNSIVTRPNIASHLISFVGNDDVTATTSLAAFIGLDPLTFNLVGSILNNLTFSPNAINSQAILSAAGSGTVTITYLYTPFTNGGDDPQPPINVPEPSTLAMLGLGLLATAGSWRRRQVRRSRRALPRGHDYLGAQLS